MSSAFLDELEGGGTRRSGEVGLVGAAEEPAVGLMLAGERGTACSSDSSVLSLVFTLFKLNSSPEDGPCSECSPCIMRQGAGRIDGGELDPWELRAVGCSWDVGLGRNRVPLRRAIVNNKSSTIHHGFI
jgi:hypothetical protein